MMSNKISELDVVTSVNDSDLLVASQQDKYVYSKFNSCGISGITLMDILAKNVMKMRKLEDTASLESGVFSLYDHNHDSMYNKLSTVFDSCSYSTFAKLSSHFKFNVIDDG